MTFLLSASMRRRFVRADMRKRFKRKLCCCAMCKAHKRGKSNRWKFRDFDRLKRDEKECHEATLHKR